MTASKTILSIWQSNWQKEVISSRIALQDANRKITYGELYQAVSRQAGRLRGAGICDEMRVAIDLERSLDAVIVLLAVMVAGACPCPLEPRLSTHELFDRLETGGLTCLLSDDLSKHASLGNIRLLNPYSLPEASDYWSETVTAEYPALMLFTSGSTGKPKGVLESHLGVLNNALGVIDLTELTQEDVLLHVMPIYHTNGLNNQLFSPLAVGATVYFAPRFSAQAMPDLMRVVKPTIITGVPTMYSRMLSYPLSSEATQNLRFARCGSAPITIEQHKKIEAYLGRPLLISYGLSEATCTSTINPPQNRRIGSVGKILINQDVFIQAADGHRINEAGKNGEICIDGDNLMLGYVGVKQAGRLEPQTEPLHTGDIGYLDEDGYLYITGRIKDVIIRGGENISPSQIEHVISMHPDIANCCVIGKPDEDLGEVPVAFITTRHGKNVDIEEVQDLLKKNLSRIYLPESIFMLDALPENAVGKVDRKALAQQFI